MSYIQLNLNKIECKDMDLRTNFLVWAPRGRPLSMKDLAEFKVDASLVNDFVKDGVLVPLGDGYYCFAPDKDNYGVYAADYALETAHPELHLGGKSALSMYGISHNVYVRPQGIMYGHKAIDTPVWAEKVRAIIVDDRELFDFSTDLELDKLTLYKLEWARYKGKISCRERAVLEMLYLVVKGKQDREEAENILNVFIAPDFDILNRLLNCCVSEPTCELLFKIVNDQQLFDLNCIKNNKHYVSSIGVFTPDNDSFAAVDYL